jgi:hypothetical protein
VDPPGPAERGVHRHRRLGQYIYVNSEHEVVIVKSSTGYHFDDNDHETIETVRAIAEAVAP